MPTSSPSSPPSTSSTVVEAGVQRAPARRRRRQPPDFTGQQGYRLTRRPAASTPTSPRTLPGGKGQNIIIADIEYSWNVNHEDLTKARLAGALIANGTPDDPFDDNNHGTAVLGEIVGDENAFGVTGIVSGAAPPPGQRQHHRRLRPGQRHQPRRRGPGRGRRDPHRAADHRSRRRLRRQDAGRLRAGGVGAGLLRRHRAGHVGRHHRRGGRPATAPRTSTPTTTTPMTAGRADSGAIIVGAGNAAGCTDPGPGPARLLQLRGPGRTSRAGASAW